MNSTASADALRIRLAENKDAPIIVRLVQELAEMDDESSPINEAYVGYYLSQLNCHVLLAEMEGQAVGLLSYQMKPDLFHGSDTGYISELVVTKSYRGRGVGSALMEHLIGHLISIDCVEVSVSTMPHNLGAIQFYKQHGLVDEAILLERHLK